MKTNTLSYDVKDDSRTDRLTPEHIFMVRGRLAFSRLSSPFDGEELQRENKRLLKMGCWPMTRPYTTATVRDAQVVFRDPSAAGDPSKRTPEETYALASMFSSARHGERCFTAYNKTRYLPAIAQASEDGRTVRQLEPLKNELATGMDVTLVLRVFENQQGNRGVTLDMVILNEKMRCFKAVNRPDLTAYGFTFEPLARAARKVAADALPPPFAA